MRMWMGLAAVLACGCTADPEPFFSLNDPTIQVQGLSIVDRSAQGASVEATVQLHNSNDVPLPLVRRSYTITIEGFEPFSISDEVHRTLPARGYQLVKLPAAFALDGGDLAGRAWRLEGSITYRPPGQIREVLTESYVPLPSVSFSDDGSVR
jgi:hypothetical protein